MTALGLASEVSDRGAMSYLREIMNRLRERSGASQSGHEPPAMPYSPLSERVLEEHLQTYREHLQACSDAMLPYEWAWLEDHLATLQLSSGQGAMQKVLGGPQRVADLLRETQCFQAEVRGELSRRGLEPGNRTAPLAAQEHAWELSNPAIRQEWGIDQADPLHG
jgi:hypothetical protein